MTKENMETVRTLVDEVFKIKEANQGVYISIGINMHKERLNCTEVNVGVIGDSDKCFITGGLDVNNLEIPVMLDTIKGVVESAKNYKK